MRASSDGWSVTVRALVRRVLTERRYGMQPVGIHLDISYSNGHSTTLYESASRASSILRRPPRRARVFRRLHAFLRDRANPIRWTLSRAPAWASSEVASLAAPGTRGVGPWAPPRRRPERAPRVHSGATAGRRGARACGADATATRCSSPVRRALLRHRSDLCLSWPSSLISSRRVSAPTTPRMIRVRTMPIAAAP
jgi:hypothetical protein